MAGFNYELGRSNNMVSAEDRGMITIGRWAKKHKVSAAAAQAIMQPSEAHHTGTGRRGKSRLTAVIAGDLVPTQEQLAAMRDFDVQAKAAKVAPPRVINDCVFRRLEWPGRIAKSRVPTEVIARGDALIYADGRIARRENDGRERTGWEKFSGVVIAHEGQPVFWNNLNARYDAPDEIAARICKEAQ